MRRRDFIKTGTLASLCALFGAAFAEPVSVNGEKSSKKYLITIVRRVPGDPGDGKPRLCPVFRDNQVIQVESPAGKPAVFCDTGWEDIAPSLKRIAEGKTETAFCWCSGSLPVCFKIEQA
jgi:hypothetical protein